ncbi:amidohydrolase family protein [Thalassotalea psychrophila]|uniref:Amidohydrolase family protein n=1 Tax=Thalassotalea psychrophila TaxID=3065647 RepID=A0ABY9TYR0_9GAMM|nr:amidohydrolase family protein [Colwelliaceae bacterium SQ149]
MNVKSKMKFVAASVLIAGMSINSVMAAQTLFTNVNVFNGTEDKIYSDLNVLVDGNKITVISAKDISVKDDAMIIDGTGKTLMPGLMDTHVHPNMLIEGGLLAIESARWDEIGAVAAGNTQEWLYEGFTTIRGMGATPNGLKKTIDKGIIDGPRIYPSGSYISQTSGHADIVMASMQENPENSNLVKLGLTQLADGEDEIRKAVRRNFAVGASQIKLMIGGGISSLKGPLFAAQFTDAEITAAVEEAAARDTYVAVHVYQDKHVQRAIRLGVKSIEHGQFISEETARMGKEAGVFFQGNLAGMSPALLEHPVYGGNPIVRAKVEEFIEDSKNYTNIIRKVQPNMAFTADLVNESGVNARRHRDHEKWVWSKEYGNFIALKSMTSSAGELVAMSGGSNPYPGKLGVVEVGALADLLLVDGNPLEDISVIGGNEKWFAAPARDKGIKTLKVIMKDGKIYKNTL